MDQNIFPKWTISARNAALPLVAAGGLYLVALVWYGASPATTDVGYEPEQPVPFSHALHAGELNLDCRYCHNTVERTAHAAVPPAATCMNCHSLIKTQSPKLELVRESDATGKAIPWVKVHDLSDFAYFDHSAHVTRGVGCVSCHGRIDQMEVVYQHEPLSMGWCLDCHRAPENHLRPPSEVTNMVYTTAEPQSVVGARLRKQNHLNPSTDCSTCHR